MTGPDAQSLVSVRDPATGKRGSGYLLAPNLVLTAAHYVKSGAIVKVRRYTREDDGRSYRRGDPHDFHVEVLDGQADFALLCCSEANPLALSSKGLAGGLRLGRLLGDEEVPAQALGFPQAQTDDERVVNVEDARGSIAPRSGSLSKEGPRVVERLNFQVDSGTSRTRAGASLWSGMSGAALFSGNHLLGVIVEDRATIAGRLSAIPVSRIFGPDGSPEANDLLCQAVGAGAEELSLAPVWAGDKLLEPAYSPLPQPSHWSETDLLEARYRFVPFQGRAAELQELTTWCARSEKIQLRLLQGEATAGKTRLARELCYRMSAQGWVTGLVDPLWADFSKICELSENRLLVIDDADAHAGQLEALLAAAAAAEESGCSLRILAVAHGGGPWWEALRRRYERFVDKTDPPPLLLPGKDDRLAAYRAAVGAFARWYRQSEPSEKSKTTSTPEFPLPSEGAGGDVGSYLLILIQALVDARAGLEKDPADTTAPPPHSRTAALLDYVIDVERQRWRDTARGADLRDDPVLLERVVAISSLAVVSEAGGETEAAGRLGLVPDLANEPALRRAFARWQYSQFGGEGYLRSLQPLRLAERIGTKMIAAFPELASQLLDVGAEGPGTPDDPEDQCRQVLKVLQLLQLSAGMDGSASGGPTSDSGDLEVPEEQKLARVAIEDALREHATPLVRLVRQAAVSDQDGSARAIGKSLAAALNTTLRRTAAHAVAAQVLNDLNDSCPDAMVELAVAVAQHAVEYYQESGDPQAEENRAGLAAALHRLALYLARSGQRSQAREVAWEAVDTYRALEQMYPSPEHQLRMAEALSDLADRLDDVGQFDQAHDYAREAVQLLERLHHDGPDRVHPFRLAKALCTKATVASHIGRPREALQAATEAFGLTEQPPEVGEAEEETAGKKAFALRCLAWQLGENGRHVEALGKACEAVKLYAPHKRRWQREYAHALSILGCQQASKMQWNESIETHRNAVKEYEALELENREAVRPQHVIALHRLASSHLGRAMTHLAASAEHEADPKPEQDLKDGLEKINDALNEHQKMGAEDRRASRSTAASAHCLRAQLLIRLGDAQKAAGAPPDAIRCFERAQSAAETVLAQCEQIETQTWQTKWDKVKAEAVIVEALQKRGKPRSEAWRASKKFKEDYDALAAEEPNRVEKQKQEIGQGIEELLKGPGGPGYPAQPDGETAPHSQRRAGHKRGPGRRRHAQG